MSRVYLETISMYVAFLLSYSPEFQIDFMTRFVANQAIGI